MGSLFGAHTDYRRVEDEKFTSERRARDVGQQFFFGRRLLRLTLTVQRQIFYSFRVKAVR